MPESQYVEQPLPVGNDQPHIHDLVAADLQARKQLGIERYGQALQAFNGRKALLDAYEELLDLTVYLKQFMIEAETPPTPTTIRQPQLGDYVDLRTHLINRHGIGVSDAAVLEQTQVIQAHLTAHRSEQDHDYQPWGDQA